MRIAWLVYGDLEQPTGGYVYDRLVVDGLRAHGDELEVVDPIDATATSAACERADVLVGDALCVRELGPLFEGVAGAGDAGDPSAQSHRDAAPRVLLVHHLPSWEIERSDRERMHGYEARALAASDRIVVTGVATRERLAGGCPGLPVDVVAPGADRLPRVARTPRVARPATSRSGVGAGGATRVELLFVGSLVQRKRVTLLLDALENLPGPYPALTLLGDSGREPEHARAIAERIDASDVLRSTVTIAGVVGDDALARWLARADALVLPSSLEGYGMVLTEALHAGLPVIAARPAANAAGIAGLGAVRVFDDARDLAEVLERFVGNPGLRDAMQLEAAATPLPTWADAVGAFRQSLASARRRRP